MQNANYDKLDLLCELIDPIGEIIGDKEALLLWKGGSRADGIKQMIQKHKDAVIRVLAAIEGEDPDTYRIDGAVLLLKVVAKFSELQSLADALFPSAAQSADGTSSGPHTGAIQGGAQ